MAGDNQHVTKPSRAEHVGGLLVLVAAVRSWFYPTGSLGLDSSHRAILGACCFGQEVFPLHQEQDSTMVIGSDQNVS